MNKSELPEPEDTPEISDRFCLNTRDRAVIATAIQLLGKILRAPFITPAEIVSVAKMLHVLKRLPARSEGVTVSVGLSGPRRWFGEQEIYHFWQVNIVDDQLEISSGGHFYRQSTGGDTFTCMQWNAQPGQEAEYDNNLDQLRIVDDAQPFDKEVAALDLAQTGYTLDITDDDNPLLEEDPVAVDEEDGNTVESVGVEYSEAEQKLAAMVDEEEGRRRGQFYTNPPGMCDLCGRELDKCRYFVDGTLIGTATFACMCPACFLERGGHIGWGKGQIYQREPDGKWLMVAGCQPE